MKDLRDSSVSSLFHPDRLKPLTVIEQVPMEGYLHETFSSRAQDSSQTEGERIQRAFQSGSNWTLQKLPDCLEPGSIQNKNKLQTMTNLFGESRNFAYLKVTNLQMDQQSCLLIHFSFDGIRTESYRDSPRRMFCIF